MSYLSATLIASFKLNLSTALFIPTEDPEFEGLTKTGYSSLFSTYFTILSIEVELELNFLSNNIKLSFSFFTYIYIWFEVNLLFQKLF